MAQKIFESFIEKVMDFPFWVKEVIYMKLREDFESKKISETDLNTPIEESYQLHVPLITLIGKRELEERAREEDESIYRFLQCVNEGCSIAEITLKNFWTLQDAAKVNIQCLEKEYIAKPTSARILASGLYLSSRIRMGEYFKRIGRISEENIKKALLRQRELKAQGKSVPYAQVLISMGFVTDDETQAIINVKEESKKRFIFNSNMLGKSTTTEATEKVPANSALDGKSSAQLALLRQEIYNLQSKLNQIAAILKK